MTWCGRGLTSQQASVASTLRLIRRNCAREIARRDCHHGTGSGTDMERTDLNELHCITPLRNLRSILEVGILSHVRAAGRPSVSIANPEVQQLRAAKRVPGGRMLHEYANLYISARNAMLYQVLGFPARPPTQHLSVCVLGVDTAVLDLPDVVITDRNAASILSIFLPSPQG